MVELGDIGGIVSSYLTSGIFWIVALVVLVILAVFFYGYFSRRSKLKYNCLEFVRFGNGKVGINFMKAGIFKTRTMLFGMFDFGPESVTRTTDGRIIQGAKSSHLHDVFGRKGFIVIRSPKDSKILVPLGKIDFDNMEMLMAVASGDYRDASSRIFREAVEETRGTWEKILPYVMVALVVIMTIINVIINQQMTNHTTDKVGDMLIQGCQNVQNVKPAGSP